jgi:voltage-gated potassium channel
MSVNPHPTASTTTAEHAVSHQAPYLLFILLVSVLALCMLLADVVIDSNSDAGHILFYADTLLCVLFFGDFIHCLWRANNKTKYMLTWGWLDLVSSIPAVGFLRWGRLSRVVRVLRVLRGVRSARILMKFILERRAQSALLSATLSAIVVLAISSIAVLEFERAAGDDANIRTPEDAMWWSIVTMATVGYGDYYPVTIEGQLVAAALMVAGVGLIGTWSGIAASWFWAPHKAQQDIDLQMLHAEIKSLRELIEVGQRREATHDKTAGPGAPGGR